MHWRCLPGNDTLQARERTMFKSDRECIGFMKGLYERAEELLRVLGATPARLPTDQEEKARELLRVLKGELKDYYTKHQTRRAKAAMLPIERTHCFPAVHEAMCEINVTPNHRPSARWIDELVSAQGELRYYLDQFKG